MPKDNLLELRIDAHKAMDQYWKLGLLPRWLVYKKIAIFFNQKRFHVAQATKDQCLFIINHIGLILGK